MSRFLWFVAALSAALAVPAGPGPSGTGASLCPMAQVLGCEPNGAARPSSAPPTSRELYERIEKALRGPTELEFINLPLPEVIDYLKDYHKIEILLDQKAVKAARIAPDTPVSISVKGIPLASALDLMLENLGLTYQIHDDLLLITTPEAAKSRVSAEVYNVADLLAAGGQAQASGQQIGALVDAVRAAVTDGTEWKENRGNGSVVPAVFGPATLLVVVQDWRGQQQVARLLADLRAATAGQPACAPPTSRELRKRIEEALRAPTEMEFICLPLNDVINYLRDYHKIPILLDEKAIERMAGEPDTPATMRVKDLRFASPLEIQLTAMEMWLDIMEAHFHKRAVKEARVAPDTPVTMSVNGIPLASSLDLMLESLGLTYQIHDDVLLITSPEAAKSRAYAEVYDVADLLAAGGRAQPSGRQLGALLDAVRAAVTDGTEWKENGGNGSVVPAAFGAATLLVVAQDWRGQQQVARLLANVRAATGQPGGA